MAKDEATELTVRLVAAQVDLEDERKRNKQLSMDLNKQSEKVQEVEADMANLRATQPQRDQQTIEAFCPSDEPWLKISDSFIAGFLYYKAAAMDESSQIFDLTVPSEIDLSPELENAVKELRPDALAILLYLREHAPYVLTRWESGVASPYRRAF